MSSHIRVDHSRVATCLRLKPGVWLHVGEYETKVSATSTATMIRTAYSGTGRSYQPAGSCEARIIFTEHGANVEARYVGLASENDSAWADAVASLPRLGRIRHSTDTERVLGQIERGEVRAGPAAAREIAAKAEAAYGGAWRTATVRPISPAAPAATTTGADAA